MNLLNGVSDTVFVFLLKGISTGQKSTYSRKIENSVRAGQANQLLAAGNQCGQLITVNNLAIELLKYTGHTLPKTFSYSGVAYYFVPLVASIAAPLFIAYKVRNEEDLSRLRIYNVIHNHIGTVAQVATVAEALLLIAVGQTVFGGAILGAYTVNTLCQRKILPLKVRQYFEFTQFYSSYAAMVLIGSPLDKLLSALYLTVQAACYYFNKGGRLRISLGSVDPDKVRAGEKLSKENILEFKGKQFSVNRNHFYVQPLPEKPKIDVRKKLQEHLNQLQWDEKTFRVLRCKLKGDPVWKNSYRDSEQSDAIVKDFFQKNYKRVVDGVLNKDVEHGGEFLNYELLNIYLACIVEKMDALSRVEREDFLFKLVIEGGRYCGVGVFEVVEDAYLRMVASTDGMQNRNFSLEDRIYTLLIKERNRFFEAVYEKSAKITRENVPDSEKLFDLFDVHNKNYWKSFFARRWGLIDHASEGDLINVSTPFQDWCDSIIMEYQFPEVNAKFDHYYTPERIVRFVNDAIVKGDIPRTEIFEWWSKRELLPLDELCNLEWFPGERNSPFKERYISFILYEMGIFKSS